MQADPARQSPELGGTHRQSSRVRLARFTTGRRGGIARRDAMRNRILLGLVLGVSVLALSGRSQSGAAPPLTALDRIEIEQLAIRYTYGLDTAADNGYMYAD